jgi:hypothetical protein
MEKYKELNVPEIDLTKKLKKIQNVYCMESGFCLKPCLTCIFDASNIEVFKEWFNTKKIIEEIKKNK